MGTVQPAKAATDSRVNVLSLTSPNTITTLVLMRIHACCHYCFNCRHRHKLNGKLNLVPAPVVFVHGYRETADVFDNLNEFISSKGYTCISLNYDSTLGIEHGAKELELFLQKQKKDF